MSEFLDEVPSPPATRTKLRGRAFRQILLVALLTLVWILIFDPTILSGISLHKLTLLADRLFARL